MASYFDETIFRDARTLGKFVEVNAFNRADVYLLEKSGIVATSHCSLQAKQDSACDNRVDKANSIANVNPIRPCRGTNIFTMDMLNKGLAQVEPYNQITVYQGESSQPIDIADYIPQVVYTVGGLTSFESAIMIKYYAINFKGVTITRHLFALIKKHFNDHRSWFNYHDIGITQNQHKELLQGKNIINAPLTTIYGPAIDLI